MSHPPARTTREGQGRKDEPGQDRETGQDRRTRQGAQPGPAPATGPRPTRTHNRVTVLLVHVPRYSIRGQARLAADVAVSRSTISRLVNGRTSPSHALAQGVTDALGRALGRPLDVRDVFSTSGTYPTRSGCALCRCAGCLPPHAWAPDDTLRPEWRGQRPGDWSLARPPTATGDDSSGTDGGRGAE